MIYKNKKNYCGEKIVLLLPGLGMSDHPGFPALQTLTSWPTTVLTFLALLLKQQNKVDKI
jgi:hypothetical protein